MLAKEGRKSMLFPFGGDRSRSKSPVPKTITKSRDVSPAPGPPSSSSANHSRSSSATKLRSSRSSHNLRAGSQDLDARGRQPRLSSIMASMGVTGKDADLTPPPSLAGFGDRTSSPTGSNRSSTIARPQSSAGSFPASRDASPSFAPHTPIEGKLSKRMSWLPGSSGKPRQRSTSVVSPSRIGTKWAFVAGPEGNEPYDTTPLVNSQKIDEIWEEDGNMFVHFYDKAAGLGPSFKIHSSMIASSKKLTGQASAPTVEQVTGHLRQASLSTPGSAGSGAGSAPMSRSSSAETDDRLPTASIEEEEDGLHLYLRLPAVRNEEGKVTKDGLETLIRIRNMFAFLVGQVLIGDEYMPTLFAIFMTIGSFLRLYQFQNVDGNTLGEAAESSFLGYMEDLSIGDVRQSHHGTLEAIALGERMKCLALYNEGYVHAVGKWNELTRLNSPVMDAISVTTKQRLEKSYRDFEKLLMTTRVRLEKFEFPSLFAGVLNSNTTAKMGVGKGSWKAAWVGMRNHVMGVYKQRFGQWPPKAKSKKNDFDTSGLNRIVSREMYNDFCDLYDMLVDRTDLTPRSFNTTSEEEVNLSHDPAVQILRKFMSEYDNSSPPVIPPIPYDVPLLPSPGTVNRDFATLNTRKQVKERSKKPKDDDINAALMQSYNRDSVKATPFIESFMAYERSAARGKTWHEISEQRIGQWMFLYVVIQSLPLLAIDAPGLKWTQGVEYFLCEVPKGTAPWSEDASAPKKAYYKVSGTQGYVSLPTDIVEHGTEGLYRRSHCWMRASEWNPAYAQPQDQQHQQPPAPEYLPHGDLVYGHPGETINPQYPAGYAPVETGYPSQPQSVVSPQAYSQTWTSPPPSIPPSGASTTSPIENPDTLAYAPQQQQAHAQARHPQGHNYSHSVPGVIPSLTTPGGTQVTDPMAAAAPPGSHPAPINTSGVFSGPPGPASAGFPSQSPNLSLYNPFGATSPPPMGAGGAGIPVTEIGMGIGAAAAADDRRKSSIAMGLEPLAMPPSLAAMTDDKGARRKSTYDPNKTFDSFLSQPEMQGAKKKGWK